MFVENLLTEEMAIELEPFLPSLYWVLPVNGFLEGGETSLVSLGFPFPFPWSDLNTPVSVTLRCKGEEVHTLLFEYINKGKKLTKEYSVPKNNVHSNERNFSNMLECVMADFSGMKLKKRPD